MRLVKGTAWFCLTAHSPQRSMKPSGPTLDGIACEGETLQDFQARLWVFPL